jgi:hypothetical protein
MEATIRRFNLGSICPRYEHCSAAYCPAIGGKHLPNEPVCALLREAVKTGAEARLRADIPGDLLARVLRDARRLIRTGGALGRELRRAARHGSQIEAGHRLRGRVAHEQPRAVVHP